MTTETREIRFTKGGEIRVHTEGGQQKITGYAAVFDSLSEDLGGFRELVAKTAFTRALKENQDVRGLIDHNSSKILGRTSAGTMVLEVDEKGLRYEIDIPDTQAGRDIVTSIKRSDVTGSSFSFDIVSDEWRTEDGQEIRTLTDVDLFDVGPVSFPAYPATVTEASFRSLRNHMKPNLERFRTRLDTAKRYAVVSKDN